MGTEQCVVLNSTYEPLDIMSSLRGLKLILRGKAQMVKKHARKLRSQHEEIHLPATIALTRYVKHRRPYTTPSILNNRNLFIRDNYTCQYCGRGPSQFKSHEKLTRDHVVPKALGGKDEWTNVVTSCSTCNNKKANFTLDQVGMSLKSRPYRPLVFEIHAKTKFKNFSWEDILEDTS